MPANQERTNDIGRRCVQELNRFNESMGWTLKNLNGIDAGHHSFYDSSDGFRSAFGNVSMIPDDFVAPSNSVSKIRGRNHSKRATKSSADLSFKAQPDDGAASVQQFPLLSKKRGHKTARSKAEPIDFVYDINVRRKLREQIDADRRNVLSKAKAREAMLRSKNMWVFDKRTKPPIVKAGVTVSRPRYNF